MRGLVYPLSGLLVAFALGVKAEPVCETDFLKLPEMGDCQLLILSPTMLELSLVTAAKQNATGGELEWDFADAEGRSHLPGREEFQVFSGQKLISVATVGYRRRVVYASFKHRDLRIGNYLYLQLNEPVELNQTVEVKDPGHRLWAPARHFSAKANPLRWSPAIHVNQTGYLPAYPKKAMVGYYLGSLGELNVDSVSPQSTAVQPSAPSAASASASNSVIPVSLITAGHPSFQIVEVQSSREVFHGQLTARPDRGFPFAWYQQVLEADFSELRTPGEYRLVVPGLGASFSFVIGESVAGAFARTYALGLYHQRCGMADELPFTRFTHGPCHTAPAQVPDGSDRFASVNDSLQKESADYKDNPRHTAPQLKNVDSCLYPFVNRGPVDVHGGHHDAGDYSKYTINSAGLIHHLVFAADVFPGVSELDNLGLPESGDGKSDVLQEAKWEADFLARMQDADGGFYFLVYPRDREYESDVLPDHGDPQVVFPKTTAVTAAATAALAQCASSPTFRRQFPEAARLYLEQARRGWGFLERAQNKFGQDGAYQKITHYGDEFMHDDELAWAACELFLATGEPAYQSKLIEWLHPNDPATRKWGWWRLFDAYGCAIRSYAFAAKIGKIKREQLDPLLLSQCEDEIAAAGADQLRRSMDSAYGTSLPAETKASLSAGWYFSGDAAFDLAVACQLDYPPKNDPRPQMREAMVANLNYEAGCNPINLSYLTGLGWKRQREIVSQYAQNARRRLPPSGIPLGNVQSGFGWLDNYKKELGELSFPPDGDALAGVGPYPVYDRWGDSFNLSQEFVVLNQARALGYLAWLMAQTPLKTQPWKPVTGRITGLPDKPAGGRALTVGLAASGVDLATARIIWEAAGQEPAWGTNFTFTPAKHGPNWVEAEALLPDGRRVFAMGERGK